MRVVAILALSAAILVGGSTPVSAFDTPNFGNTSVRYQDNVRRVANNMNPNPASMRRAFKRLYDLNIDFTTYLDTLSPDTCQTDNGFRAFKYHANQAGVHVGRAYMSANLGDWAGAKRQTVAFVRHSKNMDTVGARILQNCW